MGLVAKLYETQSELDRVREEADNALDLLYNQVGEMIRIVTRSFRVPSARTKLYKFYHIIVST